MTWLLPQRIRVDRQRLDAVLAENETVRARAEEVTRKAVATATADQRKLEETLEETRRRAEERRARAERRAAKDPSLGAVTEVLKLLERRS